MIDPSSLYLPDSFKGAQGSILTISEIPPYDQEDYDTKDFNKYLKDVEKVVRSSFEYREFIKYIKCYYNMYHSASFENITGMDSGVRIEIHHTPFSLYDIVKIVYDKRAFYHEDLQVEMVAKEVMELHYKQLIGLYPLTETEHKLVHNGYLFIPTHKVWGRYDLFFSLYREFAEEYRDTLDNVEDYSKVAYDEEKSRKLMAQSNVYIDTSGAYSLPILDKLKAALTDRVSQIKQNAFMLPVFEEDTVTNPMDELMNKPNFSMDKPIFNLSRPVAMTPAISFMTPAITFD